MRGWLHSGDGPRVGLCPGTAPQEAGAAPGPARGSGAGVTAGRCFFLVPSSELRFAIRFCSAPSPAAPQIIKPEIILIGSRIHKGFFFCVSLLLPVLGAGLISPVSWQPSEKGHAWSAFGSYVAVSASSMAGFKDREINIYLYSFPLEQVNCT